MTELEQLELFKLVFKLWIIVWIIVSKRGRYLAKFVARLYWRAWPRFWGWLIPLSWMRFVLKRWGPWRGRVRMSLITSFRFPLPALPEEVVVWLFQPRGSRRMIPLIKVWVFAVIRSRVFPPSTVLDLPVLLPLAERCPAPLVVLTLRGTSLRTWSRYSWHCSC